MREEEKQTKTDRDRASREKAAQSCTASRGQQVASQTPALAAKEITVICHV
jgi:ubiquitin